MWVIELENQGYAQSFGTPSADPYLATTLPRTGALLENYYAIGHSSAANYIAQVSGQAPDIATQIDCRSGHLSPARSSPGRTASSSARAASTRRQSRRSATRCPPPGAAGPRTCRTWARPEARVPELGASGAIAAVLGAYFLLYPGSRIRTWIFPVFLVRIPAWIFLALWFLYQLIEASFGLFSASANGGGVVFFAHVGGFVFGLVVTWLLARAGQVAPQEPERSIA